MDNLGFSHPQDDDDDPPPPPYENPSIPLSTINNNNSFKSDDGTVVSNGNQDAGDNHLEEVNPGRCGIFCWKPEWLQRFPTKHWFIVVFLIATTVKGMAGSYFPSTITSLEKRLKISTETIGYVTSGNEIAQILFSLALSYLGGKGHRPRWMALGIFFSAVAYMMYATPHFLYGPGNEALSYTEEYYAQFHNSSDDTHRIVNSTSKKSLSADLNADGVCKARMNDNSTSDDINCGLGDDSVIPMGIIFTSQFIAGIGSVLLYTLAGPFLDDHMKPLQAPMMIAVTGAVRQTGPLIGYFVAFLCLRVYVSPLLTPLINNKDDRWLGAWWLGCVIFSIAMASVSLLMVLFPRVLNTSTKSKRKGTKEANLELELSQGAGQIHVTEIVEKESHRNEPIFQSSGTKLKFWASLVDLMKNKANLWNNLSLLFFGFAFSGFATYFPKYLEIVIKQNAANAALTTGLSSIFFQVAGLLLSGYIISKFRLRARSLAAVNIFVDILVILVVLSFSQLVCKQGQVVDTSSIFHTAVVNGGNGLFSSPNWSNGTTPNGNDAGKNPLQPSLSSSCIADCDCTSNQNTPVCYLEKNQMFASACDAGCKSYDAVTQLYTNCSCLPSQDITLAPGKCVDPDTCFFTFVLFVSLMAMVRFGSSFGRIGNVLIPYRCVDRSQKSLATGLSFVMWAVVSIPSPIMYGKFIDSACIRWGTKCGGRGNCLLYDDVKFAYAMSSTAAALSLFGLICDVMVWYYVKDLKLYGEETESEKNSQPNGIANDK